MRTIREIETQIVHQKKKEVGAHIHASHKQRERRTHTCTHKQDDRAPELNQKVRSRGAKEKAEQRRWSRDKEKT